MIQEGGRPRSEASQVFPAGPSSFQAKRRFRHIRLSGCRCEPLPNPTSDTLSFSKGQAKADYEKALEWTVFAEASCFDSFGVPPQQEVNDDDSLANRATHCVWGGERENTFQIVSRPYTKYTIAARVVPAGPISSTLSVSNQSLEVEEDSRVSTRNV